MRIKGALSPIAGTCQRQIARRQWHPACIPLGTHLFKKELRVTKLNALMNPVLPEDFLLPPENVVYGQSAAMQVVHRKVAKAASANIPVLLEGESGTGKDVVGRIIHMHSTLSAGPFVKVSCPAIPGTLLESELFGYEKGAFTGAYGTKPGRVEMANRGSLFLDEIGEMDPLLQAKLLQLLQDGRYCRIGAQQDRRIEVRIICATNRNLAEEVDAGTFRKDLFYRINVLNIRLPALRERMGDLEVLVDYLLHSCEETYGTAVRPIPHAVLQKMKQYQWPGNIRELENVVKRYAILDSDFSVIEEAMESWGADNDFEVPIEGSTSLKAITRQATLTLERRVIRQTLEAHRWNRKRTAQALNISYRALLYKIKEAGIATKRMPVEPPAQE